jgi:hypothetical protein
MEGLVLGIVFYGPAILELLQEHAPSAERPQR